MILACGAWFIEADSGLVVEGSGGGVDDVDQVVVELCSQRVGVGGGVVSLSAQDVNEVDAGLVEPASFADRLEAAVELERSGAVSVGEQPVMRARWLTAVPGRSGGCFGFDGLGGLEVLVGDVGVGDPGVD